MIKFRAWDKLTDTVQDVLDINFKEKTVTVSQKGIVWYKHDNLRSFEDLILMQSTGLKDKNGVEIYQDDVVNMCWSDEIGESHWGKITIKNPFDYCIEEARYLIHADELEVIGNIYANPELLSSGIE